MWLPQQNSLTHHLRLTSNNQSMVYTITITTIIIVLKFFNYKEYALTL